MKTTCIARIVISSAQGARRLMGCAGISLLTLVLLTGCQTAPPQPGVISQASVVFQYNSRDHIFITKPSYRDAAGYLRQIRRPEVTVVVKQLQLPRGSAVVALPWEFKGEMLQAILADWSSVLKECGFRQAIFVRSDGHVDNKGDMVIATRDLT